MKEDEAPQRKSINNVIALGMLSKSLNLGGQTVGRTETFKKKTEIFFCFFILTNLKFYNF